MAIIALTVRALFVIATRLPVFVPSRVMLTWASVAATAFEPRTIRPLIRPPVGVVGLGGDRRGIPFG